MDYSVKTFFDQDTYTLTYVVYDENTKDAVIIDPVLDYDPASSKVSKKSLDILLDFIKNKNLNLKLVLETHAHADHLTSAHYIKEQFPDIKVGIGANIRKVQQVFKDIYNLDQLKVDGSQFDLLLEDNQEIEVGSIKIKTINTPGHTPACVSYLIADMVFTGDALFMPDYGTGRCDFPAGSARDLYNSVKRLYELPDETKVYTCHDYQPNGRELRYQTTIGESKKNNIQLKEDTPEAQYVSFRTSRDKTLNAPRLLLPSIQINVDAGTLPAVENNGAHYLKIPISFEEES